MSSTRSRCTKWKSSDWAHKRGRNTKVHMAMDALGMPIRAIVTDGTTPDSKKAIELLAGFKGKCVLADKGYDSDEIIEYIRQSGMEPVIPPRKSRKEQRYHDRGSYKSRHLIENLFLKMKRWRGVACRYAKNLSSFQAIIITMYGPEL